MLFDDFRRTPEPVEEQRDSSDLDDLFVGGGVAGGYISERGSLALPAFYRAVKLKSDIISTLPLYAFDGTERMDVQPLVIEQPDPDEDVTVTIARLVTSLNLRGNAFALTSSTDELGYARSLRVIPTDWVSYETLPDGTYRYLLQGKPISADQLVHLRGFVLAGEPFGLSPVSVFRRALSNVAAQESFAGKFWTDNGAPTGIIKNTGDDLAPDEIKALKAQWIAMMRASREPVVLNRDLDYSTVELTNSDSQFLESRTFSRQDIANMVGVPGVFVGAETSSMTYENVETQGHDLAKIWLRSELVAVERAFSALMPPGIVAKFDLDDLLRADSKTRYETYKVGLDSGVLTKDEARQHEGMSPLDRSEVDGESIDPNLLNAVGNLMDKGFDPAALLKALGLPEVPFTKPEPPPAPLPPVVPEDEDDE